MKCYALILFFIKYYILKQLIESAMEIPFQQKSRNGSMVPFLLKAQFLKFSFKCPVTGQARSKRSAFITLFQADTKSRTNFSWASSPA